MTDEEKKAMESLIEIREFVNLSSYKDTKISQLNAIDTVLNLIEKQSKEIEELKNKYSDEKIRNTVIKRYNEVIKKDYVNKDKIKAKIEEYKKQQKEEPDAYLGIKVLQSLLEKE